jgi:hypothetical protein
MVKSNPAGADAGENVTPLVVHLFERRAGELHCLEYFYSDELKAKKFAQSNFLDNPFCIGAVVIKRMTGVYLVLFNEGIMTLNFKNKLYEK